MYRSFVAISLFCHACLINRSTSENACGIPTALSSDSTNNTLNGQDAQVVSDCCHIINNTCNGCVVSSSGAHTTVHSSDFVFNNRAGCLHWIPSEV